MDKMHELQEMQTYVINLFPDYVVAELSESQLLGIIMGLRIFVQSYQDIIIQVANPKTEPIGMDIRKLVDDMQTSFESIGFTPTVYDANNQKFQDYLQQILNTGTNQRNLNTISGNYVLFRKLPRNNDLWAINIFKDFEILRGVVCMCQWLKQDCSEYIKLYDRDGNQLDYSTL